VAALSRALGPLRPPAPLWLELFLVATGSRQSLAQPFLRASRSLCGPHGKAPYLCEATREPAAARICAQVPNTGWGRVGGQWFYSHVLSPLCPGPSGHTEASAQRSHSVGKLKEPQPQDHKSGLGASLTSVLQG
uniref:Uncharacterized protein n=1 Tax=Cercocebus atys TaxID=9531 RepID=A0A2K5NHJ9_CERAT